jgi:hypothetical protein
MKKNQGISTIVSVILAVVMIAIGIAGIVYVATTSEEHTTTTITAGCCTAQNASMMNIRNLFVNGTKDINGSNLAGTIDVNYPYSSQSGNINASVTNATLILDTNDSFFVINADGRVIVNLIVSGNHNSVFMNGMRLNLTINGNLNDVTVMPQSVIIYGKQINGQGNQFAIEPLPP